MPVNEPTETQLLDLDRRAYAGRLVGSDEARLASLDRAVPWYRMFLAPWLPPDLSARILDVPCGGGNLLYALRQLGYSNVRGVDIDERQVAFAQRLGLAAERCDAFTAVEYEAQGSVELLFSLDFIEHLEKPEAVRFLGLARSRLRRGGRLLLRTPSADGPFGSADRNNDVTHKWGMTSGAAIQLLRLSGFDPGGCRVVQEAPVPYKWQNRIRLAAFKATTKVVGAWLDLCGIGSPKVWTRSMWVSAQV